jgi:hypothetical protein
LKIAPKRHAPAQQRYYIIFNLSNAIPLIHSYSAAQKTHKPIIAGGLSKQIPEFLMQDDFPA